MALISSQRLEFHEQVITDIVRLNKSGIPSFADSSSKLSSKIAKELYRLLSIEAGSGDVTPQASGKLFEEKVEAYIRQCFQHLSGLRPGDWTIGRNESISRFDQYEHLDNLLEATKKDPDLAATLGRDYVIKPDIVVLRSPITDTQINETAPMVDDQAAHYAPIRKANNDKLILHASVSCKWTIRSDRSQNSRTEALNLIRNRKGHLPHIVVVTAEPTPNRIASIALGTGDVDCVYHFALEELQQAVINCGFEDAAELLNDMVVGRRLRDISDLPLDLAT